MNLGNFINRKIKESKYENKKEIYEVMKDIIGENCCAYNTFTEALSKNKSLSDIELLTLSTLLDIDLNKLALHYIKSQINASENLSLEQYFANNRKSILLFATYISRDKNSNVNDNRCTLDICNKKIYYIIQSQNTNSISCYEFDVKKGEGEYFLRTNQIADFDYFDSILEKCDLNIDEFMELELDKKIEILKREGIIYYDLFPEKKQEIEDTYLSKFEDSLVREIAQYCFDLNKDDINIAKDNRLYSSDGEKYESYFLEYNIEEFAKNNNLSANTLSSLEYKVFDVFKKIASDNLSVS